LNEVLIYRQEDLIQGKEDLACLCRGAAVAMRSCIFNTVGTTRGISIRAVLLEADRVGGFVIGATHFFQIAEVGIARQYINVVNAQASVAGCWIKLAKISDINAVYIRGRPDGKIGWKRIRRSKYSRRNGQICFFRYLFFARLQ
jgi:hypothetical protein